MDHGNPMRIAGGGASAREGGGEADDVRSDSARAGRIRSTRFEEEKGENSMNPMVSCMRRGCGGIRFTFATGVDETVNYEIMGVPVSKKRVAISGWLMY